MGVKLILSVLLIASVLLTFGLLLISCSCETEEKPAMPTIYIIGDSKPKTFVVSEQDPLAWFEETKEDRNELNMIRYTDEYEDDQEEFEIKSQYSNVRRIIDHEVIVGYDEELDNPRFKEVDS